MMQSSNPRHDFVSLLFPSVADYLQVLLLLLRQLGAGLQ